MTDAGRKYGQETQEQVWLPFSYLFPHIIFQRSHSWLCPRPGAQGDKLGSCEDEAELVKGRRACFPLLSSPCFSSFSQHLGSFSFPSFTSLTRLMTMAAYPFISPINRSWKSTTMGHKAVAAGRQG